MSCQKAPGCYINTTDGKPSAPVMHYHGTYDLYYIESGKREYFVEDTFFTACAGDFVLIKPTDFHQIGQGQVLRTLVSFTEAFLTENFSPSVVQKMAACFDKPRITPPQSQQQQLQALLDTLQNSSDETHFAVTLAQLLLTLNTCTQKPITYDTQISRILEYINHNFSEIRSLDQIATHMSISKQHLCRLFKNATGMTLTQYMNKVRIQNACALLERSDKSLSEICLLCGFGASAYFSTVFKNSMGMPPLKYRQIHR